MIEEANNKYLDSINDILQKEFNVDYSKNEYSKEYVYVIDNKIVGFIIYEYIYDRIELDYIYVLPEYRKNSIASKLMNHMIDFSSKANCLNITLEVNENNQSAINLYKKFGFVVVATRKGYYNGQDGYLMIRE